MITLLTAVFVIGTVVGGLFYFLFRAIKRESIKKADEQTS